MEGSSGKTKKCDIRECGTMYRRAYWPNEGQKTSPKTYSPMPEEYKKSIDPKQMDKDGRTALHLAILQGKDDDYQLERVIKIGCDVEASDKYGNHGIHLAAERGLVRCIQKLLKHKANPNVLNRNGYSPLMLAARHGFPAALRVLSRGGANPNLKNDKNELPLHYAVCNGHQECVEELLSVKTKVNHPDAEGNTPLILATKFHRHGIMTVLLSFGANPDLKDIIGRTALHWVATVGTVQEAMILLQGGAETDSFDNHGFSPFVYCIQTNNHSVMRCLLESGCDRNTVDGLNGTALALACLKGHKECARILLETGDDPDELGFFGLTPLMSACFESHVPVVETLLSYGADPNVKGRMGASPLVKSLVKICSKNEKERHAIVAMLIRTGADVNAIVTSAGYFTCLTKGKNCPLSFALCSGYTSLIYMLLIAGSKISCDELRDWYIKDGDKLFDKQSLFAPVCEWKYKTKPLRHLCRMVIRKSFASRGWGMVKGISSLPIAPVLQRYVNFSDLDDIQPTKADLPDNQQNIIGANVATVTVGCTSALRALEGTFLLESADQGRF